MSIHTGKDRILLLLNRRKEKHDDATGPYNSTSQKGISHRVDISKSRASKILSDMKSEGLINEKFCQVKGSINKRKSYTLTEKGEKIAEKTKKKLREKKVLVKTQESEFETKLKNIDISGETSLIHILNNMNEDGVVDFRRYREKKKTFRGRKRELKKLKTLFEDTKKDNLNLLLVKGPKGVGKKTLIKEFTKDIEDDYRFFRGSSYEKISNPFYTFKDALKDHEDSMEIFGGLSSEGRKKSDKIEPTAIRKSMFYDIKKTLENLASIKPIIFSLEKGHWMDNGSFQLLHYLIDRLEGLPIFILLLFRPDELNKRKNMKNTLKKIEKKPFCDELKLEPLDWEDIQKMISDLVGIKDISESFVDSMHRKSEGYPLFVEESLEELFVSGEMKEQDLIQPERSDKVAIPSSFSEVLNQKVEKLNGKTKRVLEICSVLEKDISYKIVKDVTTFDKSELDKYLDILTNSKLLMRKENKDIFDFPHHLFQETLYENLPDDKKRKVHSKVADSIKNVYSPNLEKVYEKLAYHYKEGGMISKAIDYYIEAGERDKSMYSYEDAIQKFEIAFKLMEDNIDGGRKKKSIVLTNVADCYRILGSYEESLETYRRAREIKVKSENAMIYANEAEIFLNRGLYEKVMEKIEEGLSITEQESIERYRLLVKKAHTLRKKGKLEEAKETLEYIYELKDKIDSEKMKIQILNEMGSILGRTGELCEAKEKLNEAIDICRSIGEKKELGNTFHRLGNRHLEEGEFDKAKIYLRRGLEIRREIDDFLGEAKTMSQMGVIYQEKMDYDNALNFYEKALDKFKRLDSLGNMGSALNQIGIIHHERGEFQKAIDKFERSLEITKEIGNYFGKSVVLNNLGEQYYYQDKYEKALEYCKKSLEIREEMNSKSGISSSHAEIAKIFLELEKYDKAKKHAQKALDFGEETGSDVKIAMAANVLGMVQREIGDLKESKRLFGRSMCLLEAKGENKEIPKVKYEYGLLLEKKNHIKKAEEEYKEALSICKENKKKYWEEKIRKKIEAL